MTRQTFYRKLRKYSPLFNSYRDLFYGIRLRKDGMRFCPLTAVAYIETGQVYRTIDFDQAGMRLGLSSHDIRKIMLLADFPESDFDGHDILARRALVRAVSEAHG